MAGGPGTPGAAGWSGWPGWPGLPGWPAARLARLARLAPQARLARQPRARLRRRAALGARLVIGHAGPPVPLGRLARMSASEYASWIIAVAAWNGPSCGACPVSGSWLRSAR